MSPQKIITGTTILAASISMVIGAAGLVSAGSVAVAPAKSGEIIKRQPTKPVQFRLGIGAGYLTGESTELVYWPDANNHKASELKWDIDSLFMVGVNASLQVQDWFTANFEGWFKATDGDGYMEDYDWLAIGADWTDLSQHDDTDVTDGSIIDINANFSFYRSYNLTFTGIAGFKQDEFGWEARGGDYIYSENGYRDAVGSFPDGELGISYVQQMSSLYGGLGFEAKFSNNFQMDGRIIYSPFVQGEATDYHHLRNLVTYDNIENGDLIAFDLAGRWFFTPNMSWEVAFSYQKYGTTQGDSEWHYRDQGYVEYIKDSAGMDQMSTMFSTSLNYTF